MEQSFAHDKDTQAASVEYARKIAEYLDQHGGEDVRALDISQQSSFADAFVIVSANSTGQIRGLYRRTHEIVAELELTPRQSHKRDDESGWLLVDCDSLVIHLMLQEMREFYDLEKLWFDSSVIYPE
jgi:ribosome-associated protein